MRHIYIAIASTAIILSTFWYQSNEITTDIETAMNTNFDKLIYAINNPTPTTSHASKTPNSTVSYQ